MIFSVAAGQDEVVEKLNNKLNAIEERAEVQNLKKISLIERLLCTMQYEDDNNKNY